MMVKNKKTIITAVAIFLVGLLTGWLLFSQTTVDSEHEHKHEEVSTDETIWTCSMHPQIRQPEPGDCPICGMDLIPLEEEQQEDSGPVSVSMSPTAMQLANVQTAVVQVTEPIKEIILSGKVQPDERRVVSQSSHIPGRIEQLGINFTGEFVRKGQSIASIYSPQLITAQEELIEASKMAETHPGLLKAAKERLRSWRLSDQQIENMMETEQTSGIFDIVADVTGYVTAKLVNQGDYVDRGQIIYEIADLSQVWILLDVYEQNLQWIGQGDEVQLAVKSLPGDTFKGTISWVSPVIDPQTRVAQARVNMSNARLTLKPGMLVTAQVESKPQVSKKSIIVPKSAVMWTGRRSVAYVKQNAGDNVQFNMREVELGPSLGNSYIIESGLEEGEEIAVSGTFSIDAAAQLSGKPSMMMPPESKTFEVSKVFREQITHYTHQYFTLKNALVNDDPESALSSARKMDEALKQVDMSLLEDQARDYWMKLSSGMQEALKGINSTTEIEKQRIHFKTVSDYIIDMTETFGLELDKAYIQFCPMAFNDAGAHWLSESDEILNPYFGDVMLNCGEVEETYRRGQRSFKTNNVKATPANEVHHH